MEDIKRMTLGELIWLSHCNKPKERESEIKREIIKQVLSDMDFNKTYSIYFEKKNWSKEKIKLVVQMEVVLLNNGQLRLPNKKGCFKTLDECYDYVKSIEPYDILYRVDE